MFYFTDEINVTTITNIKKLNFAKRIKAMLFNDEINLTIFECYFPFINLEIVFLIAYWLDKS